ncbi:enoyl-CoA hydratase/isomerase family protein [Archangium violaceum]|uniref:3-hydroxyacyl-CoA dehydrogenase NAD-binding domain-containing protein n=1 Tax=Archangium violaceum TaxID=83451 RepID=UPI00193C6D36|nr:3-hydroxyacyl-CoA dehydrogenase NAD-binding domain-containing protein [Archangium violaceum]QRK05016.1 enoyl-CoA hydratase/isomerase family protein [Archangium violaceum]
MSGRFEAHGDVGILWIDNPPVNAISQAVRVAMLEGLKQAESDSTIKALVIACAGRTFMAGADISEFSGPPRLPSLPEVIDALDAFSKPVVAAIHGTAFGGGFEVALACDYRVALANAQVGLPEVKLGILPGAGGTQRLPRLAGVEPALQAMISGDPIPAPAAQEMGAIDKLVVGDLTEAAVAFAREKSGSPRRRVRDITLSPSSIPAGFFDAARQRTAKEKRNLFSPQRIIDAVEAAVTLPFDEGIRREQELFFECAKSSQAKALQHVFFAERQVAKIPGLPADVKPRTIKSVGIIGAGTMGGGIAMNFANAGIPVTLLEVNQEGLDRGLGVIRKNYEATAAKGRLTSEQVETRMGLIKPTLSYDALADADLLIEAVFETLEVKKKVFETLDRVARKGAILASNTSYLSIDTIAGYTSRPEDVLGMHFFSPANVMKLLEIVRGARTAPDVLATALDVAKRIKKVGVVAGNCHGFIGNRMLEGYGREGSLLVLKGATPQQVDQALVKFGMPMGVLQMFDLAGLDIGYKSRKDREPGTFDVKSGAVADKLVEMGRLGQKTKAGFYDYEAGQRTPIPSDVVARVIEETAAQYGIKRRELSEQEILERCFLAMVNIGCEVLREGIAYRASDIDIVYLYGYGFPAHRGGPMFWAEHELGLPKALERIREYARQHGPRWWTPSPLLERLVAEGKGFAQAV